MQVFGLRALRAPGGCGDDTLSLADTASVLGMPQKDARETMALLKALPDGVCQELLEAVLV